MTAGKRQRGHDNRHWGRIASRVALFPVTFISNIHRASHGLARRRVGNPNSDDSTPSGLERAD
jgi:hypothetical protein